MNDEKIQPLLRALHWRYATKVFDPGKRISSDVWSTIEQALVLTPSSYGLQPYRFLLVANPEKRAALLPHSWSQRQVVDCSHFVVFTARTGMDTADVDKLIQRISLVRGVPSESLEAYRNMMLSDIVNGPRGKTAHDWAARQAYIALGSAMTAAAILGVDACPMEGLNPAEYDRVLGLAGSGYTTIVACAFGYRAANDKSIALPKVRFESADLIKTM